MEAPEGFRRALEAQSLGKLRIRWSKALSEWQIEERVAKPQTPTKFVSEFDDRTIRFRDGFALLLRIRPGDRMPCKRCKRTVKLAVGEFRESTCGVCGERTKAVYFPLSDMLLEYIRGLDPQRGGYARLQADLNYADGHEKREAAKFRDEIQHGVREEFHYLTGAPRVGYTKDVTWPL